MDEIALKKAQKGDPHYFEVLVTPYEDMIWRVCYHYTHHREDASDCMQEAMVKMWRSIGQYRGDCSLKSWIYRVCATVCIDHLRHQGRMMETDSTEDLAENGFEPADPSPTPEESLLNTEAVDQLQAAIDALPGEMKTALVLYALENQRYEDIAVITGASVGTVKSRISRARDKMLRYLKSHGNNSPSPSVLQSERRTQK